MATGTENVLSSGAAGEPRQGMLGAKEGPAVGAGSSGSPHPYGPNNEQLPAELQAALQSLVRDVTTENPVARRWEVRKARRNRLYWRGHQHIWWDEARGDFRTPFEESGPPNITTEDDMPRYQHVTNIYQAFGLSLIAVLSQKIPPVRWFPESAENPQDVSTAKAATKVKEYIERNNDPRQLLQDIDYYFYTDGKAGTYTRWVADAQRFGTFQQPIYGSEQVKTGPDMLGCQCGWQAPADHAVPPSAGSGDGLPCPQCGRELTAANVIPGPMAMRPVKTGEEELPQGQEVIDVAGALELKTPIWAKKQCEFPYLQYAVEAHISSLKAAFPHVAEKIEAGQSLAAGENTYERIARLTALQGMNASAAGGEILQHLTTFSRVWLRPQCFTQLEKGKIQDQLKELFADGCYVAFAGDVYCESRNESMDSHWKVRNALPGDGQDRPSMGDVMLPVQDQVNDLMNIAIETYEYGVPATFVDEEVVDVDALEEQSAEPGAVYSGTPRPGQPMAAAFYSTPAAVVSPDLLKHLENLIGPIPQFLTGAQPALFGGAMEDQKTARGYAMARAQAMGRLGIVWGNVTWLYAGAMSDAVECFKENRTEDVTYANQDEAQEYASELIAMANLKGNAVGYPDSNEALPQTAADKQQLVMQFLSMLGDQADTFMTPENMEEIKVLFQLDDFELPKASAFLKQRTEIKELLESGPQMGLDAQTGQPAPVASSVPVDPNPVLEDHQSEFEVCVEWLNGDIGLAMKAKNPAGRMNVRMHALEHYAVIQKAQMAQQAQAPLAALAGAAKAKRAPNGEPATSRQEI